MGLPKKVVQKVSELGASGLKASAPRLLLKQGSQAPGRRKDKTRLPSSSKGALKGKAAKI